MKTILATAYAVNPYKGSEDGMGWNMTLQIARHHRVITCTRENNRPAIERFMAEHPDERYARIRFVYFDLPYWMRFWKKGSRGAMLYYQLWQLGVALFLRKYAPEADVVHNVNFHNNWTPSFLWLLGKPFVWGPVGHHSAIPGQLLRSSTPVKAWLADRLRWSLKVISWHGNPLLWISARKADAVLAMNSRATEGLSVPRERVHRMPSVGIEPFATIKDKVIDKQSFEVLSIGRFVPLKGFDMTVRAFAAFWRSLPEMSRVGVRLTLIGQGPEEAFIRGIIAEEKLPADAVTVLAWMDRSELGALYQRAGAFLFPSYEGAGMVVAEAMAHGLPVICYDNEGPGELTPPTSALKVPYGAYDDMVFQFARRLQNLYTDRLYHQHESRLALNRVSIWLDWNVKGDLLKAVYSQV